MSRTKSEQHTEDTDVSYITLNVLQKSHILCPGTWFNTRAVLIMLNSSLLCYTTMHK